MLEQVTRFIEENIYQSKVWDNADDKYRKKAINTAKRSLSRLLPHIYGPEGEWVDIESLAEQTVWIMKLDDTFQRAEMGATSLSIDGVSIAIKDKDRSLAPFILEKHGISSASIRRKVGSYQRVIGDSSRVGWRRHC